MMDDGGTSTQTEPIQPMLGFGLAMEQPSVIVLMQKDICIQDIFGADN